MASLPASSKDASSCRSTRRRVPRPTVAPVVPRFTVKDDPGFRRCIADKAVTGSKTGSRTDAAASGRQPGEMIADLNPFVRGWAGYFGFSQWRELPSLDGWIRRRLRASSGSVEDARSTLSRAPTPQRPRKVGQCGHFSPKGPWRLSSFGSAASRLHQSSLSSSGSAFYGKAGECLIRRTARGTDPYATVGVEGWHRRCPLSD